MRWQQNCYTIAGQQNCHTIAGQQNFHTIGWQQKLSHNCLATNLSHNCFVGNKTVTQWLGTKTVTQLLGNKSVTQLLGGFQHPRPPQGHDQGQGTRARTALGQLLSKAAPASTGDLAWRLQHHGPGSRVRGGGPGDLDPRRPAAAPREATQTEKFAPTTDKSMLPERAPHCRSFVRANCLHIVVHLCGLARARRSPGRLATKKKQKAQSAEARKPKKQHFST